MKFQDGAEGGFMELEAAKEVDYYFMKGSTMDRVVAQYRKLTGQSPMMPRYIFGYIQSKERYTHSKELVDVVQEYRRRQVPLDVIVQDWNYWPGGQWGYMKMNRENYPDPRSCRFHTCVGCQADGVHLAQPTNCPQTKDFERRGLCCPVLCMTLSILAGALLGICQRGILRQRFRCLVVRLHGTVGCGLETDVRRIRLGQP